MKRGNFYRWDLALLNSKYLLKYVLLIIAFAIIHSSSFSATYYVSTLGNDRTGKGSYDLPWFDPEYGMNKLKAGDSLYLRGGRYYGVNNEIYPGYSDQAVVFIWDIHGTHDGTAENPIVILNFPGENPVIDASKITTTWGTNYSMFMFQCDYWIIKGLHFTGASQQKGNVVGKYAMGLRMANTQNCIVEQCKAYGNEGVGISLYQTGDSVLCTRNLILNCDSYNNYDPYSPTNGGNADGIQCVFAHKGSTNTISGCRAWYNSDDGYDTILNDGIVIFESCWAWKNGRANGNGDGIKLGDMLLEPDPFPLRIVKNCLSFYNKLNGFDDNEAEATMLIYNNTAWRNDNYGFQWQGGSNVANIFRNNIADSNYLSGNLDVAFQSKMIEDHNSWNVSPNFDWISNDKLESRARTDISSQNNFVSLDSTGVSGPRKPDGSLPDLSFLKLRPNSVFVDAGLYVGLNYTGNSPDLGAYELSGVIVNASNGATSITSKGGTLQLNVTGPSGNTITPVIWSIVNGTGMATINPSGLVTAVTDGTVTVTAKVNDGSGMSGSMVITISNQIVSITRNNSPVINDQQFTIQESTFTNSLIGTVIANDIDLTQSLSYTIISGNESGIFSINPLTGQLTTIGNNIFGPVTLTHELIVKVTDNADEPKSASANITVKLIGKSTIVYINPDNSNDQLANGSFDHPLDSWDDVTWKEGSTYLQKRGTETTTNKILIGASKVTLGAYGEGESPVISSQTNTYLISGFEKSGIRIGDLNLQAPNAVSCIYFLGNSADIIIIEHCELKANANAIKVVGGSSLVTKYNTITSNHEGIYSTAVSNEIYYNIFKSCNTAVNVVSNSSKANIYNNVFFDNEKSLSMTYAELTLYNNIFYMTTPGQVALSHGTGNIESDHNIFYPEQAGFITIANTQFNNLDELQKSLKIDINSFNADPLFVDIYNENFSLEAGSPAINAGVDLQLGIDYQGSTVPLAGGTDIGINEFTGPIIPSKKPNEKSVMTIYPNPSSGQISIMAEIKQDLLLSDPGLNQREIRVMDISGKTVFSKLLENQNSSTIQDDIDLAGISNGLYFVVLHIANEFIKEKLIIAK